MNKVKVLEQYLPPDAAPLIGRWIDYFKCEFKISRNRNTKFGDYTEMPDDYQEVLDRLLLKHKSAAKHVPAPVIRRRGSNLAVITLGGCDPAVREAIEVLAQQDLTADLSTVADMPARDGSRMQCGHFVVIADGERDER